MCTVTNNSTEVREIVEKIRQGGLVGTNTEDEIVVLRDAVAHLCNMTETLKNQDDVSPCKFSHSVR